MRSTDSSRALAALALLLLAMTPWRTAHAAPRLGAARATATRASEARPDPTGDLDGVATDSTTGAPLSGAEVLLMRNGEIVARTSTDRLGHFHIHNLAAGSYQIEVRLIGFHPVIRRADVSDGAQASLTYRLSPASVELTALTVGSTPIVVDTRTGDQVFKQDEFQGSPTLTTSQILQQAIAGAARAPTGEVHIRGQHAEYSYYLDGVPVPPGISGSLNELFDPSIVNQINFQTGSWDAEYGGRNAAIVNVTTRVPSGGFHATVSGYGGNFASNGQTLTASDNIGRVGVFLSVTRTATDLRREPLVADTDAAGHITAIRNYANSAEDLFGFAKLQFSVSDHDVFNVAANWSRSSYATPFDSSAGVIDDHQRDINAFVNAGWTHRVIQGPMSGSELFTSAFYRRGSLTYVPGLNDAPGFTFAPDTTPYNISEARSFDLVGAKVDYLLRLREELAFKFGALVSSVRGNENFQSFDATGAPGPASLSALNGRDIGVYAQTQIAPSERWEVRAGLRFESHRYPLSPTQDTSVSQLSPRIRLSWFPSPATTMWVYYGRQFMPTNTEDLRAITSSGTGTNVSTPTLPERDDFFEVGLTHRFAGGVVTKLAAYHKRSSPGIDDTQVPGTAITTDVNIEQVRITGLEAVLELRPRGPLSGFLNLAINHAWGSGAVTGGFFTTTPPAQPFDLDHDQRLSAVAGLTFAQRGLLFSATGIYGSGLTNGVTPNAPSQPLYDPSQPSTPVLGTGLFDFNTPFKVDPSFILNLSAGYTFTAGGTVFRPQLFVDNVLDLRYALKGAFFSGATFGKPRTIQLRLSVGI